MADPNELAEKIASKAEDALSSLHFEMTVKKWPAEFRAIMWGAVRDTAASRAAEADREHAAESQTAT